MSNTRWNLARPAALFVGGALLACVGAVAVAPVAGADPALAVSPQWQTSDGSTPIHISVTTSVGADSSCELYRGDLLVGSWAPCLSSYTFRPADYVDGDYRLRARSSTPGSWRTVWSEFVIDRTPPSVKLLADEPRYLSRPSLWANWEVKNKEFVKPKYELRQRIGSYDAGVGDRVKVTKTDVRYASIDFDRGETKCVDVRAIDVAGNVGEWSNVECHTRLMDERQLDGWRSGNRWKELKEANFHYGTGLMATARGSQLTLHSARVQTLVIWGRTGPWSGRLEIKVGDRVLDTVSLKSRVAKRDVLFKTDLREPARGRLKLTVVTSGKPVTLDALAISSD